MRWLRHLLNRPGAAPALELWRRDWVAATAAPEARAVEDLRARLDRLDLPADDLEIEREMLDGLDHVVRFAVECQERGLPVIETGHRVVGVDLCHFSAPASMPDDPWQPCGRLLLTSSRAIFVGGARSVTLPWHAAARPLHADRDLILGRVDATVHRFRCNSFDDVLRAAFIARRLARH